MPIQNVFLTRGTGETFWRRLWRPVIQFAEANNKYEARLLTPSGYAFYQHGRHNRINPHNRIDELADLILDAWRQVWNFQEMEDRLVHNEQVCDRNAISGGM